MNWVRKPKYPVKEQLQKIVHHNKLPLGTKELGRINDPNNNNKVFSLVRQGAYLSILKADIAPRPLKNGEFLYTCGQTDFPLGALKWFCTALIEFCKSPAEGGLHAGAMSSADEEVEGEMLCIQRAMGAAPGIGGYAILNRSRNSHRDLWKDDYCPQEVTFADNLLYEAGLLDLIKNLGEKYSRGEI